ncbi:MAG: type II toxin-antitoxin system VapC family toxin [Bryobacteraceae bacterium]
MASLVVDTHSVLWYIFRDARLSSAARDALHAVTEAGDPILVPSICIVEVTYLAEKGRIPVAALERLTFILQEPSPGFEVAPLNLGVAIVSRQIPRDVVPDLPDRVIAATALSLGLPLFTADRRIRSAGIQTIW